MTRQQKQTAEKRRELVKAVRVQFRPHFFMRCLELAYRVIPCCKSCEYNKNNCCAAPLSEFEVSSGFPIKDQEYLCLKWSPSPEEIAKAMYWTYSVGPKPIINHTTQRAAPKDKKEIDEMICRVLAGEISVNKASKEIDMPQSTLYRIIQKAKAEFKEGKKE